MTRATIVTPPGRWQVTLAGLTTAFRRPTRGPRLPVATLMLPDIAVEGARVADYRRLCGFGDGVGVPPVYPHLLAFPLHMALMMRSDFPFAMAGLVHVANRIVQHRRVVPGEPLAILAHCDRLLAHPRGQAFAIAVRIRRGTTLFWESESIYLHRAAEPGEGPAIARPPEAPGEGRTAWRGTVPRSIGNRYARLSGDRNPIHTSAIGARLFGFRRPIAHGMWSLARALAGVLPPGPVDAVTIDTAFRTPLLLPGEVVLRVDDAGRDFALAAAAGDHIHLTGRIDFPGPPVSRSPGC